MPAVGTTHHVKIGSKYYLIAPGSYRKRQASPFGARFTSGDPDYSNLTLWQHWVQYCWVGGFGAETFVDDAMFDEAAGVDTTNHELLVLARDLGPTNLTTRSTDNWNMGGDVLPRVFYEFNATFYCLSLGSSTTSKLWKYVEGTDSWALVHTFSESIKVAAVFGDRLWFGDGGGNLTYMTTAESFSSIAKPAGRTEAPYAMMVFRDRFYVSFGRYIWRMKPDFTWDGTTEFYEAVGISRVQCMEQHLGFLYMASVDGHVLRTDGNATFDIWQFDPGVTITAMRSYDGRLFVNTFEGEVGTTATSGVLYQFTGAAVTELKRWGLIGKDTRTNRLRVFARRLWFGASNLLGNGDGNGFGVACYDSLEDAYHIWATSSDISTFAPGTDGGNMVVDDVAYWKGNVFLSNRGHGVFRAKLTHKDISRSVAKYDNTAAGGAPGSKNGGWLESSDFDAGTPGLIKFWRQIAVHVDLPSTATSVWVETSTDGGATWTYAGVCTKSGSATRYRYVFGLNKRQTRLKYRLTLRTTDTAYSPVVRGVLVSYLPMPDPTWTWDMTLICAENPELLDGTIDTAADPSVDGAYLEGLLRAGAPVGFTDVDGTVWNEAGTGGVIILDFERQNPQLTESSDGPIESFYRITLIETAESGVV